ncbi:MAG TPA: DUF6790 family protein [Stellaceae bacterium]|nr:DUF6790 family protein [Stellaceae bacterium]
MIAAAIGFLVRNLPAVLFVAALIVAAAWRGREAAAERFLSWVLLLPIGVAGLWAALFHLFFPDLAAAHIGWAPSPFQFEVGVADLAIGITACLAFRRDLGFKAAAVSAASVFLLGDAVGHVRQMLTAGNFAPGNAGVPFFMDILGPALALALLAAALRRRRRNAARPGRVERFDPPATEAGA